MSITRLEAGFAKFSRWKVPVGSLRAHFDPESFPFKSTQELPESMEIIGQERAVRAMDFGLHVPGHGYNIYAAGIPGTGKSTIIKPMIRQVAETRPPPADWC